MSKKDEPWWHYIGHDTFDIGRVAFSAMTIRAFWTGDKVLHSYKEGRCDKDVDQIARQLFPKDHRVVYENRDAAYKLIGIAGIWQDGYIEISRPQNPDEDDCVEEIDVSLYTSNESIYRKVIQWCEDNIESKQHEPETVWCLSRPKPSHPYSLIRLGKFAGSYEPENYSPEVIRQFGRLISDINSPTPRGRMAIIHGPPGTGKTFLLKALSQAVKNALVIFIPNSLIGDLGDPELIQVFSNNRGPDRNILLLVEDADVIFRKRDQSNTAAISSALNLADGMIGELMGVYIVGTTNVTLDNIDDAVKRPGRLSESIHVGSLTPDHAVRVFQRLNPTADVPDCLAEEATLATVYSLAMERHNNPNPSDTL